MNLIVKNKHVQTDIEEQDSYLISFKLYMTFVRLLNLGYKGYEI
jgi:hypothetical protein